MNDSMTHNTQKTVVTCRHLLVKCVFVTYTLDTILWDAVNFFSGTENISIEELSSLRPEHHTIVSFCSQINPRF